MGEPRISVIVPMHNEEHRIRRCLSAIAKQTWGDFEVLIIDDGSTDQSAEVAKQYPEEDSRFRLIHQEWGGLSAARNTGIDEAKGEWLCFIDGDDEPLPTMLETLYAMVTETSCPIAVCDFQVIPEGKAQVSSDEGAHTLSVYTGEEKYRQILRDGMRTVVQWNKLFHKSVFEAIRFPEGKTHEDEFVIHLELEKADRVVYTNQKLYNYYIHKDSITGQPTMEKRLHVCQALYQREVFYRERGLVELARQTHFQLRVYGAITRMRRTSFPDFREQEQEVEALLLEHRGKFPYSFAQQAIGLLQFSGWYLKEAWSYYTARS